jgi:EAL domain-containing protein (putative c-di-GMP-specific phosphodiesterase class I)
LRVVFDDVDPSHRGLSSLLKNVERAEAPRARYDAIRELAAMLVRHFSQEEKPGGFFDMVTETVPRHAKVVAELRQGHASMLDDLKWLATNVEPHAELSKLAAERLSGLVTHLHDHEAIERRILRDAVLVRSTSEPPHDTIPTPRSSPPDDGDGRRNRLSDAAALRIGDDVGLAGLVDRDKLSVVFQPIIDMLTGETFAHEVLVRCDVEGMTPPVLFERAVEKKCTGVLGRVIREIAMAATPGGRLFVNIHPDELSERWLVQPDDPIYASSEEIYLEITESAPMTHYDLCHSVLRDVASRVGVHLAVDDLGAGYSNLLRIAKLEPSVVKLDRSLIMNIHRDQRQRILVTAVVDMCVRLGAEVVAEGIETLDEYFTLLDTGVHYAQGYLFARPAYPPPEVCWPPTANSAE